MLSTPPKAPPPLASWLRLLRPLHWLKNGFVFMPLLFSGSFLDPLKLATALETFAWFSLASSWGYVFNDLRDLPQDRLHRVKSQKRPLAAGLLQASEVWRFWWVFTLLLATATGLLIWASLGLAGFPAWRGKMLLCMLAYLALTFAYSRVFKHWPFFDVVFVALGMVLRVAGGSLALETELSPWMLATTFLLGGYLIVLKRLQELQNTHEAKRRVLACYSRSGLQKAAFLAGFLCCTTYGTYCLYVHPSLLPTLPLVGFGFLRYHHRLKRAGDGGESPPENLISDPLLLATVFLWLLASAVLLLP